MCAHRLVRLSDSYWSKRRRIQASVQSHIADLQSHDVTDDAIDNIIHPHDGTSPAEPDISSSINSPDVCSSSEGLTNTLLSSTELQSFQTGENDLNGSFIEANNVYEGENDNVDNHTVDCDDADFDTWSKCGSSESDESIDFEECDYKHSDEMLEADLHKWADNFNISRVALGSLLQILHPYHPRLPVDSRTLLHTPRSATISNVAGGVYHYIGIQSRLERLHQSGLLTVTNNMCIRMQVNIDGLPLFKSSGMQLWPILGCIKEPDLKLSEPFVIGIFAGLVKPKSLAEYLSDFVAEATNLHKYGLQLSDGVVFVRLHSIVCDAPARSFLKNIKSFTGYHGCERCIQRGKYYCSRMTFPDTDSTLRTDDSFINMADEDHHLNDVHSPLAQLSIGMVTGFVLDYMHLVCLGVVRRLLLLWLRGPLPLRLSARAVSHLSQKLLSLRSCTPCEFSRKPRSVVDIDRWKATEFRQFLLFTGPLVLRNILPQELYSNFLLLHAAIFCLVHPRYCTQYCDFARKLLIKFVQHCHHAYGQQFVVYNVHSLVHLPDDVQFFGPLDGISCFPFENFLHSVKRLVRSPYLPLQQVVNRVYERHCHLLTAKQCSDSPVLKHMLHTHSNTDNAVFYMCVETKQYTLRTRDCDNCVCLKDDKFGRIQYIMQKADEIILVIHVYETVTTFYSYPLDSQNLGIVCLKNLSPSNCTYLLADVKHKCMCMPMTDDYDSFLAVPLSI